MVVERETRMVEIAALRNKDPMILNSQDTLYPSNKCPCSHEGERAKVTGHTYEGTKGIRCISMLT